MEHKQGFGPIIEVMNNQRARSDFLTLEEVQKLSDRNVIYDPFSILIGRDVLVGEGNIFYPNVTFETSQRGAIHIADANVFHSGTFFSSASGSLTVGSSNMFGPGSVTFQTEDEFIVGDGGRYLNGIHAFGRCHFGDGSQLLGGSLTVQNCVLEGGRDFRYADPDMRGGVLKGAGVAKNLHIKAGEVIQQYGVFEQTMTVKQKSFH